MKTLWKQKRVILFIFAIYLFNVCQITCGAAIPDSDIDTTQNYTVKKVYKKSLADKNSDTGETNNADANTDDEKSGVDSNEAGGNNNSDKGGKPDSDSNNVDTNKSGDSGSKDNSASETGGNDDSDKGGKPDSDSNNADTNNPGDSGSKDNSVSEEKATSGKKYRHSDSEDSFDASKLANLKSWDKGVIPYYIDDLSFSPPFRGKIRQFLESINSQTGVNFIELPVPPKDDTRYVFFINRREVLPCQDYTSDSFTRSGVQKVIFGYNSFDDPHCANALALAILGIPPQHNSPDRDKYIKVNTKNILPGSQNLYKKLSGKDWGFKGLKYDFKSASHFSPFKFTKNGKPTIEIIGKSNNLFDESDKGLLSAMDLKKIKLLYNKKKITGNGPMCRKIFYPPNQKPEFAKNINQVTDGKDTNKNKFEDDIPYNDVVNKDQGADQTTDQATDKGADQGTDQATDKGDKDVDESADQYADPDTDQATDKGADQGTDQATDKGDKDVDESADQYADPDTDQATDKGADQGTDQASDQATDKGADKDADQATDQGDQSADQDKDKDQSQDEKTTN